MNGKINTIQHCVPQCVDSKRVGVKFGSKIHFSLKIALKETTLALFVISCLYRCACAVENKEPALSSGVAVTEISFDPRVVHDINGQDSIPEDIFGMTAYCYRTICESPKMAALLKDANIPILSVSGFVDGMTPPQKPANPDAALAWYESTQAQTANIGNGKNGFSAMRSCGIKPAIATFAAPAWLCDKKNKMPFDGDMYGACAAGYAKLVRDKIHPGLTYLSLMSEANTHWWKKSGTTFNDVINTYNKAAARIKQECPDVLLGGFADCWPPAWPAVQGNYPEWSGWDDSTMIKIKKSGKWLDYFDFHAYEMTPQMLQEESQTAVNAMHLADGGYRKVLISEWGYSMARENLGDTKKHWEQRAFRCAQALFGMLEVPSYVIGMYMHEAGDFLGWTIFKSDDVNNQYPTYWTYWMFRNLRGRRIFVPQSYDDFKVVASRQSDDTIAVVILNTSERSRKLNIDMPVDVVLAGASWDMLYFDGEKNKMSRTSGMGTEIVCPPKSMAAVTLLATAQVPVESVVRDELLFGDSVQNRFDKGPASNGSYGEGQYVTIKFDVTPEKLKGASKAFLRVGMLSSRPGDNVLMQFCDKMYKLDADWYQVIQIDHIPKSGINTATFKLSKRGGPEKKPHVLRISSAVLVIQKDGESYEK